MMNRIDNSGEGIARLGRDEDNYLAHVAQGEMVVPPVITPETRQRLEQDMMNMGLDPNEYTVGGGMSINPITGNPEFGFLKKIAKGLKKVVKKIAPVAAVIPGPWQGPAIIYNKGRAAVNLAKGEGGIGDLMTVFAGGSQKVFGKDGALKNLGKANFGAKSGFMDSLKGIGSIDGKFSPFKYGTNIAKQYKDDQKQGYFGLFSGGDQPVDYMSGDGMMDVSYQPQGSSDMPSPEEMEFINKNYTLKGESGMLADKDGNLLSPADVLAQVRSSQTQSSGLGDFFKGIFKGGGSDGVGNYGVLGDLLGGFTDKLGITNYGGDEKSGGGLGNLGIAGLAGLVGKLAYEDAKNNKGVPLTPLTTMDPLGRYNVAAEVARQKGEAMPSRVEYGLNPSTLPILQGGGFDKTARKPIGAAAGGIMSFANGSTPFDINVRNQENEAFASQVMKGMQRNPNLLNELTSEQKQMFEHGLLMGGEEGVFMKIIKKMRDEGNNYQPSPNMSNIYTAYISATKQAEQMNMGGIMAFAQGGAVAMAAGGELPIDPANFPVMDGQIDGPGTETSDDIPAMLSDGEFVMTAKAVKGAGGFNVAANDSNGIVTLTPNGEPSRDSGTRVMYKLMEHFGAVA